MHKTSDNRSLSIASLWLFITCSSPSAASLSLIGSRYWRRTCWAVVQVIFYWSCAFIMPKQWCSWPSQVVRPQRLSQSCLTWDQDHTHEAETKLKTETETTENRPRGQDQVSRPNIPGYISGW